MENFFQISVCQTGLPKNGCEQSVLQFYIGGDG